MAWMSCDANAFVLKSVFSSINTCSFAYHKLRVGSPCPQPLKNSTEVWLPPANATAMA